MTRGPASYGPAPTRSSNVHRRSNVHRQVSVNRQSLRIIDHQQVAKAAPHLFLALLRRITDDNESLGSIRGKQKTKTLCEPRVSAHRLNLNLSPRLNRSPQSVASRNCHESVSRNHQSSIRRLDAQVPAMLLAVSPRSALTRPRGVILSD